MIKQATFRGGKCCYCHCEFTPRIKFRNPSDTGVWLPDNETRDHIYPRPYAIPNGYQRNALPNVLRACFACNNHKDKLHPLLWLQILPSDKAAANLAPKLLALGENPVLVQQALDIRAAIEKALIDALDLAA